MALSILYCRECDVIVAAALDLELTVECLVHTVGSASHKGYVALRLPSVNAESSDLADLAKLAVKYPKGTYATLLEPPAGSCS